jgi:GNAT superfamily N-acetyltransferase
MNPTCSDISMFMAQPSDLDSYIEMLEEVGDWLNTRGLSPLRRGIYREHKNHYADSIARSEVYFARLGDDLVATVRLLAHGGDVWPSNGHEAAFYVENLIVRREWSNRRIGRQMLIWAEEQAAVAGKSYLRLDCFADNAVLRNYYENAGYQGRSEVEVRYPFGTLRLQRYEKCVRTMHDRQADNRTVQHHQALGIICCKWE